MANKNLQTGHFDRSIIIVSWDKLKASCFEACEPRGKITVETVPNSALNLAIFLPWKSKTTRNFLARCAGFHVRKHQPVVITRRGACNVEIETETRFERSDRERNHWSRADDSLCVPRGWSGSRAILDSNLNFFFFSRSFWATSIRARARPAISEWKHRGSNCARSKARADNDDDGSSRWLRIDCGLSMKETRGNKREIASSSSRVSFNYEVRSWSKFHFLSIQDISMKLGKNLVKKIDNLTS